MHPAFLAAPVRRDTLERQGPTPVATPPRPHSAAPATDPAPPTHPPGAGGGPKLQKSGSIASKFSSKFAGFLGKAKEGTKREETQTEGMVLLCCAGDVVIGTLNKPVWLGTMKLRTLAIFNHYCIVC